MNICLNCGKHTNNNKFCSKSCAAIYNNKLRKPRTLESKQRTSDSVKTWRSNHCKQVIRCCKCCGKEYVFDSNLNTKTFCSKVCSEYYKTHRNEFLSKEAKNNISKGGRNSAITQGDNRRSKNEIYFYKLCCDHFLNVSHNEGIFNGWDADIILKDYKIAILWNGPWHYKQIGKTSLKQIQNRDYIKTQEIEKLGYVVYIIKDMGKYNKIFVEQEFEKFKKYIAG